MSNYDEIYGVDLPTYCNIHNIRVENLINKVEIDIKLLQNNLHYLVWVKNVDVCDLLVREVYYLLQKKEKHLKRLKKWRLDDEIKNNTLKSLEEELQAEVVYLDVNNF